MPITHHRRGRILAIDPGTRELGLAVLEGPALVYHGVESIRCRRSPSAVLREGRRLLLRLIRDFKPRILVIEKTFVGKHRRTALLNVLADEFQILGRRKRLTVLSYAPNTVKKAITGNGSATKEEVAKVLAARYPELKAYLAQNRKWKDRYHANRFDAVALAIQAHVFPNPKMV